LASSALVLPFCYRPVRASLRPSSVSAASLWRRLAPLRTAQPSSTARSIVGWVYSLQWHPLHLISPRGVVQLVDKVPRIKCISGSDLGLRCGGEGVEGLAGHS
jgi:hypothetical protein